MARKPAAAGNTRAKGRSKKKPTFTLKSGTETLLTTQFEQIARQIAVTFFSDVKSVSLYSNSERRVVARWNYGHRQPLRGSK